MLYLGYWQGILPDCHQKNYNRLVLSLPEILAPKLPEILAGARPMGPKGSCL